MPATAILAPEHDVAARNALLGVLREMGAEEISRNWGVAGSQEVSTLRFTLGGQPLTVEAETYVGLSITGDSEVVEIIAHRVRKIVATNVRNGFIAAARPGG